MDHNSSEFIVFLQIFWSKSTRYISRTFFNSGIPYPRQCFGSVFILYGSGSSILGEIPIRPDPIRIQGFYDKKLQKNVLLKENKKKFRIKNYNLPLPSAFGKNNTLCLHRAHVELINCYSNIYKNVI
jgi:hypothetical protein